jgi:hypothetical protein
MAKNSPQWNKRPDPNDYKAALNYLSLQFKQSTAESLVARARRAPCVERAAKDLLRASNLPLLTIDEKHVAEDLKRIRKGKPISPVLVVQGDLTEGRPFVIADGYHRICAACHADEDAPVAVVLVRF